MISLHGMMRLRRRCDIGGLLPPPFTGEGWGGGVIARTLRACPLPVPPPQAGEGTPWRYLFAAVGAVLALSFSAVAIAQTPPPPTEPQQRVTIGFVEIEGDPRHEPIRAYERLILKLREHPYAGAQVGIEEAKALTRVLKTDFALERITVKSADAVAPAILQALESRQIHFFILDTPAEAFKPLAAAVKGRDVLLFNATAPEDFLRREVCSREVVHTLPSLAMSMDALMQHLVSRKWRDVLVLQGPLPADAAMAKAFEASAKKFGARIVDNREFKAGTDPRDRDKNNPALLTALSRDYDAVFVADDAFEFARQVPYQTVRPRPVVGSIDLEPVAWHWTWEHNGAPQVNSRFQKATNGRHMESADWASWIAVKMVVQSILRTRSADFAKQREFILGDNSFDGDKGLAVSVRRWDQQLRQAVLLATPYAVAVSAPVDGFLHKTNVLDTLGDDEIETPCRVNR
jgi:ABC transporter substrate binding protein (PQQ-dependent alcohol dehydrogenase system)